MIDSLEASQDRLLNAWELNQPEMALCLQCTALIEADSRSYDWHRHALCPYIWRSKRKVSQFGDLARVEELYRPDLQIIELPDRDDLNKYIHQLRRFV